MATLGLDEDELKVLEHMLSRVSQLSSSIQSLKMDILKSNPLPPTSSLQASAQILQRNLQSVLDSLSENSELFSRMAIHPSTNYPGRTQENILTQLLRKKLEPDVEELVAQGAETARLATPEGIADLQGIWDELREWTHGRIAEYVRDEAGDVYTKEEREMGVENVRTGLRRGLDDDESDDEGDGSRGGRRRHDGPGRRGRCRQGEESATPRPRTRNHTVVHEQGDFDLPPNIEYGRKGDIYRGLQGVNIPPGSTVGAGSA
ncbi:hypothetical protein ACCO45_007126 [Purpureocillium lilacinum]|uniref:Uncharacterized protein n=1 Tax=Purpureocillium lilacinum TaxID=33203 RepID=A0ACC4DTT2_PURLI